MQSNWQYVSLDGTQYTVCAIGPYASRITHSSLRRHQDLLMVDTADMGFRTLNVQRNRDCPVCGDHPVLTELIDYEQFCGLPSRNGVEDEQVLVTA